jgi:type II secretory ATPase GspE/PulE/Tfp pilus assembly ATPase PilB-like protein
MRVAVNSNKAVGIEELGFAEEHIKTLKNITQLNSGLVLVA